MQLSFEYKVEIEAFDIYFELNFKYRKTSLILPVIYLKDLPFVY